MPVTLASLGRLKPAPFMLCPACPEALGDSLRSHFLSVSGTAVWPAVNWGVGYPFSLSEPRTALQLWTYNGSAGTDARDVGIYDAAGNLVVSIGTTAAGSNSVLQLYDIADTVLQANVTYYVWLSCAGTTAQFFRWTAGAGSGAHAIGAMGVVESTSVFALPSTITYATQTTNYLPVFGVAFGGVI